MGRKTDIQRSGCKVSLREHTPLVAIGVWAFFETLTAKAGRKPKTDFYSFFSKERIQKYKLGPDTQINPLKGAIKRVQDYGNTTKHHDTAAAFNGDQLANDLATLKDLIIKCADEALSRAH